MDEIKSNYQTIRVGQGYTIMLSTSTGLYYYIKHTDGLMVGPFYTDYSAAEAYHLYANPTKVIALADYTNNVINVNFVTRKRV